MCDRELKPIVPPVQPTVETTKATTEEEERPSSKQVLVNTWVDQQPNGRDS